MTKTPEKTTAPKTTAPKTTTPKTAAAKKTAPKTAEAKAPPKGATIEKPKPGNKPNALQQPLQPSPDLAAVIGEGTMPRGEVVSKVWTYIKANKLQNPNDGREIQADAKLQKVLGKKTVTMFEMNKLLSAHLK